MAFLIIALIIMPVEMVFQSYRILQPWLYLTFQVYEAVLGSGLTFCGIYIAASWRCDGSYLFTAVAIAIVALIGCMT